MFFINLLYLWVAIGSPNGSLCGTFWRHLGSIKGPLDNMGLKVGLGYPKVAFLNVFWVPLGAFRVDLGNVLRVLLGYVFE